MLGAWKSVNVTSLPPPFGTTHIGFKIRGPEASDRRPTYIEGQSVPTSDLGGIASSVNGDVERSHLVTDAVGYELPSLPEEYVEEEFEDDVEDMKRTILIFRTDSDYAAYVNAKG